MHESCVVLPVMHVTPDSGVEKDVAVYRCEGRVSDASTFLLRNQDLLDARELGSLSRHQWQLPEKVLPREVTSSCLSINPDWAEQQTPVFHARRSGDRSAYWQERSLKIKGCNPALDEEKTFPLQVLPYDRTRFERREIPFGVLTKEAAVREIFGSIFCHNHQIPISTAPLLVYEYVRSEKQRGCAIVLSTVAETRLESFLDDLPFSVQDVRDARQSGNASIGDLPLGSEQRLRGLNVWWWAEEKAQALVRMQWAGGFRGILNSNLGNDVIAENGTARLLLLCDFDSFEYHVPPQQPNVASLTPFLRKCFVEVILGSLPIIDYVDARDSEARRCRLKEVFVKSSSLWNAYWRHLRSFAEDRGIASNVVEQAADDAWHADAVLQAASTRVLGAQPWDSCDRSIVPGKHYT